MDVRIGLVHSIRELELELPDDTDVDALKAERGQGAGDDDAVLWLTDKKGNQVALVGREGHLRLHRERRRRRAASASAPS